MKPEGLKSFIDSHRTALVCLLLAAVTLAVYWQVSGFEFTNYDEDVTIVGNPAVLGGLTPEGMWWALTTSWFEYWHPVTWWSHMLDCELFGLSKGWHHLVNLGFHVANTLLLFAVLQRMTGAWKRSAMVAALFALHPLHVESVAWIAERKDVLSAFFFFLALWAYARYAERSVISNQWSVTGKQAPCFTLRVSRFYLLALVFFTLGLMSKPMVVTLPFVLLLLDYWPLGRSAEWRMRSAESRFTHHAPAATVRPAAPERERGGSRITFHVSRFTRLPLLVEKLPFFALSLASCLITYLGVEAEGNILSAEKVSWGLRLANVPVSYLRYLWKMIWPTDLVVLYPLPGHWAGWQVSGAVLVLVLISLWVSLRARSAPYLIVGWLLFLGVLFPAIGLVQVGFHAIADRYTYLPSVGIFIAIVWAAAEWAEGNSRAGVLTTPSSVSPEASGPRAGRALGRRDARPALLAGVAAVLLLLCGYLTWVQAGSWRNGYTLWSHCLAVDPNNFIAHYNLGVVLQRSNKLSEATAHYRAALRLNSDHFESNLALGLALIRRGQMQEATNYLAVAARLKPGNTIAHVNLGRALGALGDWSAAREHYEAALGTDPRNAAIPADWAGNLLAHGRASEAIERYTQALQIDPKCADARVGCGVALAQVGSAFANEGKLVEAVRRYREALQFQPDLIEALNNLAWLMATANEAAVRNGPEAIQFAERACALTQYRQAMFVGTLAAAYAENGRFEEARNTAQKAIALAEAAGQTNLAARNSELLRLYAAGKPCRQWNLKLK